MEEVFLPDLRASYRWFGLLGGVAVVGVITLVLLVRKAEPRLRPVLQLVAGLAVLVGTLGAGMVLWDMLRTPSIAVGPDYLLMGGERYEAAAIEKVFIQSIADYNLMGQPSTKDVAVLEFADGRTQLFGEDQYEVRDLARALKRLE